MTYEPVTLDRWPQMYCDWLNSFDSEDKPYKLEFFTFTEQGTFEFPYGQATCFHVDSDDDGGPAAIILIHSGADEDGDQDDLWQIIQSFDSFTSVIWDVNHQHNDKGGFLS